MNLEARKCKSNH